LYTILIERSTVLLVSDSGAESPTLSALRVCGVQSCAVVSCDPDAALKYLEGFGAHSSRETAGPQLVILETAVTSPDCCEFLQAAREKIKVPAVVLARRVDDRAARECYLAGANSVIEVDGADLTKVVTTTLRYWLNLNRCAGK
jgi:hypothetical protein